MPPRAQRRSQVARQTADVEPLGAAHLELNLRPLVAHQIDGVGERRTRGDFNLVSQARQLVGPPTADLDGAVRGRALERFADEPGDRFPKHRLVGRLGDFDILSLALPVVGGGEGREINDGSVLFVGVHEGGNVLRRRPPQGEHEHAGGEGIERAGMARLDAARPSPDDRHGLHGGKALGLVEDQKSSEDRGLTGVWLVRAVHADTLPNSIGTGVRVAEGAALEMLCTACPYRGFESHPVRLRKDWVLGLGS